MGQPIDWTDLVGTGQGAGTETETSRLRHGLQRLFEKAPVGLFILDNESGQFLHVNPEFARITGYSQKELTGMPFTRVVAPEDLERVREYRRRRMRNDLTLPVEYEMLLVHRCGDRRAVIYTANPIPTTNALSGAVRDVTDEKLRGDSAAHRQRMEGLASLAGGLAGEFNNLLATISGYADLGLTGLSPDSRAAHSLTRIQQASILALGHVRDLLSFAQSGSNAMELVDLPNLMEGVVRFAPKAVAGKSATIAWQSTPQRATTRGDHGQLEQAMVNILVNALEAVPASGGEITITLDQVSRGLGEDEELPAGDYLSVSFIDNGHGIAPEDQERVFQPFFSSRPGRRHTGLGLSTALGIIREHGGKLTLSSEIDRGTQVTVFLPKEAAPDHLLPAPIPEPPVPVPNRSVNVLVVDDQEYVLELFGDILEELGHRPACYPSADRALADILSGAVQPEVIIVDLLMPGMDGRTFIRRARAAGIRHPIIVTSGFSGGEAGDLELRAQTCGFLRKPFSQKDLQQLLHQALERPHPPANGGSRC